MNNNNNKKNWLWILENFDFTNFENDIQIEEEILKIKKYNSVNISADEAMVLSELVHCKNIFDRIHKLTKI